MDNLEIAKALFGTKPTQPNSSQTTTVYGIATSDSVNGSVRVNLGGDTVSMDDDQTIEVETTFAVFEGDEVIVSLVGADGTGKAPCVIGVVGRGDQQQTEINSVINYVWNDNAGLHVSTEERSVQGANVLLDSDSLDIRKGNSNSESDQTVYASFGREVTVGSRVSGGVGAYSQVFGTVCLASGDYSHAEGNNSVAGGDYSHAEANGQALGDFSHAEGAGGTASGAYSHAEGNHTTASGMGSHSEGSSCVASGEYSHAEGGYGGEASGQYSHVEGYGCKASGDYSHAEGMETFAKSSVAHAEGYGSDAQEVYSHAEGYHTIARQYQHAQGKYNVRSGISYADIVGNGTADDARSNAYNMDWNGNAEFQGEVYVGGCTPNGETPYPVVRYNTSNSKQEYYDKANSTWAQVPGGGGGGGGFTELWTNPNPTSNFAAQTVPLDLSGWSWIAITVRQSTNGNVEKVNFAQVGPSTVLTVENVATNQYLYKRIANISTSGVQFEQGYRNTTGTAGANYCIPVAIYGVC